MSLSFSRSLAACQRKVPYASEQLARLALDALRRAAADGLNVVLGLVRRERGIARLSARCGAVPCGHEVLN